MILINIKGSRSVPIVGPHGREFPITSVITLRRLRIALFATCIIPALLFIAAAWDHRVQLLRAAQGEALASVATLREHVLKTIETDEQLIRAINYRIRGMSWDEIRASSVALSNEIGDMHAGMPQVSLITVADADGRVWAATPSHRTDGYVSVSHMEVWLAQRDADQGTFFSRPYIGKLTGASNFGISRRRTSPEGIFDGTIHVAFAASYLTNFWAEVITDKAGAEIALIRTDGETLARFPSTTEPTLSRMPEASELLRHVAEQPRGGTFRMTSAIDGTERIYAYAKIGNYPLVIGYGLSVYTVLTPWRQHLFARAAIGGSGIMAVALVILAAIRLLRTLIEEQAHSAAIEEAAKKGQRMELLGQLTAGTAHDFANILQAMHAGATLISKRAGDPDRVRSLAQSLGEDAERGASLTHRILDLVRRNPADQSTAAPAGDGLVSPAEAITGVVNLLSRVLGARHSLRCVIQPDAQAARLQGNRIDLEIAIMNLVVNARDAMPDGGEVIIQVNLEQAGTNISEHRDGQPASKPTGPYVRLSVIDNGTGMSPEVLARAGELFFTTKPDGKGTGLGLAGAREFAGRMGGKLSIDTALGRGTTVTLWLPAAAHSLVTSPANAIPHLQ